MVAGCQKERPTTSDRIMGCARGMFMLGLRVGPSRALKMGTCGSYRTKPIFLHYLSGLSELLFQTGQLSPFAGVSADFDAEREPMNNASPSNASTGTKPPALLDECDAMYRAMPDLQR